MKDNALKVLYQYLTPFCALAMGVFVIVGAK
jgi:hypothetical protein